MLHIVMVLGSIEVKQNLLIRGSHRVAVVDVIIVAHRLPRVLLRERDREPIGVRRIVFLLPHSYPHREVLASYTLLRGDVEHFAEH